MGRLKESHSYLVGEQVTEHSKQNKLSVYTDRELLEKSAQNAKAALDVAKWVKTYIIITSLIYFVLWLFS